MKKRTEKNTAKRKGIFNKLGMTYIELICALALLSLIVVMFTPMLLSSYEQLYNAGEKTAEIYESKAEIEKGLASRDSVVGTEFNMTLAVNADLLFQNINVKGRKIVSLMEDKLETVFGYLRPSLALISSSHVNDDSTSHDILIQTKGLEFTNVKYGDFSKEYVMEVKNPGEKPLEPKTIFIEVLLPDKSSNSGGGNNNSGNADSTEERAVYNGDKEDYYCSVEVLKNETISDSNDSNTSNGGLGTSGSLGTNSSNSASVSNLKDDGKLSLRISNPKMDFTFSPLKINVYYVNTRGKTRKISEYIYIDPPTIMMAGETTESDYYTSAGVKEILVDGEPDPTTGKIERVASYELETFARTMRTENSPYLCQQGQAVSAALGSAKDRGVEIKSIRWIDNDKTGGVKPYYVMTGTKGSIFRMYNFSSENAGIYKYSVKGASRNAKSGFFNTTTGASIDKIYTLPTNGAKICPSLWSGDLSHVFEYASSKQRVTYGPSVNNYKDGATDEAWLTSEGRKGQKGDEELYEVFNSQAQFAYTYNGSGTEHTFSTKNSRPISYILTERGWPLRLFGVVGSSNDGFKQFTQIWDDSVYKQYDSILDWTNRINKESHYVFAFHGALNNFDSHLQSDYVLSPIRIKAMASYDTTGLNSGIADYWNTDPDEDGHTNESKLGTVRRTFDGLKDKSEQIAGRGSNINITDVIYIPTADDKSGTTFYIGNVNAFANIIQTDRINEDFQEDEGGTTSIYIKKSERWKYYRFALTTSNFLKGATTDFIVYGTDDGTGTYINKFSCQNVGNRAEPRHRRYILGEMSKYVRGEDSAIKSIATGSTLDIRNNFFYPDHTGTWTSKPEEISGSQYMYIPDLEFTFGYASNRERVYTNITYDGTTEFMRSFERLYWRSHYGQDIDNDATKQKAFYGATLSGHSQNKATNSNGNLSDSAFPKDHKYEYQLIRNHVDNDYYNVWFPGEMYNLSKIASKDGVTVAVGYAVAGSAFQYAHSTDPDNLTSTALGGIYNDGVLSAMIEGQDSSFVNLLYYKDNSNNNADRTKDSFDDDWLTTNESTKNSYSAYGSYGMHTRDSVQFTAVDIFVEEKNSSTSGNTTTSTLEYWAFYGDNKGRVFKSLVATGTATTTGSGGTSDYHDPEDENSPVTTEKNLSLPSYISDTVVLDSNTTPKATIANMAEINIGGENGTLDHYFSRISSIEAKDDIVIITGENIGSSGNTFECIVVGMCDENGNWTWKKIQNSTFTGDITDAMILEGYYYFVGNDPSAKKPFIGAVSLDTLKKTAHGGILAASGTPKKSDSKDEVIWAYVSNSDIKLNTIAGRASS